MGYVLFLCVPMLRQTGSQSNAHVTFQSRHANKLAAKQTLTCQKTPYITHSLEQTHTLTIQPSESSTSTRHKESHKSKYKSSLPWTYSNNTLEFPSLLLLNFFCWFMPIKQFKAFNKTIVYSLQNSWLFSVDWLLKNTFLLFYSKNKLLAN